MSNSVILEPIILIKLKEKNLFTVYCELPTLEVETEIKE